MHNNRINRGILGNERLDLLRMYLIKIGNVQILSSRSVFRKQNCLFHVSFRRSTNSSDHYLTLGIDKNATRQQIKQSYYKLSKQYHPDVNKDSGSEEKFKSLQAAYHILGDADRKKDYDRSLRPGNYKPGAYTGGGGSSGSGNPFQGKKLISLTVKITLVFLVIMIDIVTRYTAKRNKNNKFKLDPKI